jgi:ADP-ribosylglycohydrolase
MLDRIFGKKQRHTESANSTPGSVRSRVRGCLVGGALGDAFGAPLEFMSLDSIKAAFGTAGMLEPRLNEDGRFEITDDTQMTLFTADGILRSTARRVELGTGDGATNGSWSGVHEPDPELMRNAYARWLATQTRRYSAGDASPRHADALSQGWLMEVEDLYRSRSPGRTCLSALRAPDAGSVTHPINDSKGCGGVMRAAPIGLVPCDDPFAYGAMSAAITHGHPSGYLSAGAYAHIVSRLLFGMSENGSRRPSLREAVASAMSRLGQEPGHEETLRALDAAIQLAARPGAPSVGRLWELGAGWTGEEALAMGVYCALVGEDFKHSVRLAANHSGDSDSTASIAGALVGVQCGEEGLPIEWMERLDGRTVILEMADDLTTGWRADAGWRARYPGD